MLSRFRPLLLISYSSRNASNILIRCRYSTGNINESLKKLEGKLSKYQPAETEDIDYKATTDISEKKVLQIQHRSLKKDLFVPSGHMNSILFEFKANLPNFFKNEKLLMAKVKSLIYFFQKDCDSFEKFEQMVTKIKPILIETLLKVNDQSFVDLFTFLATFHVKINDHYITQRYTNLLLSSTLTIKDKYKLITTTSLDDDELDISKFRDPLNPEQINNITNSYSSSIIKAIITSIYIPLRDSKKTHEYLELLLEKESQLSEKHQRFKYFVDLIIDNRKLNLNITSRSNIVYICSILSSVLRNVLQVPYSFSIDAFHEIMITEALEHINSKTLYNYIAIFYGDTLPDELKTLKGLWDIKTLNLEKMSNLYPLVSDESKIPPKILTLLFDRFILEGNIRLIEKVIDDFKSMPLDTPEKNQILNQFQFSILKNALKIKKFKPEYFNCLMNFIHDYEYDLPRFSHIDINFAFQYYNSDFEGFIRYLKTVNRSTNSYKSISSKDVVLIIANISEAKRERLIETLLMNNFIFDDNTIVKEWFNEAPKLLNSITAKDEFDTKSTTASSLFRLFSLLKPSEIFELIATHGNEIYFTEEILSTYSVYHNDFEYICALLRLLPLPHNCRNEEYLNFLVKFLKKYDNNFNMEQRKRLYTIFVENVVRINHFAGMVNTGILFPSYKEDIIQVTGMSKSHFNCHHNVDVIIDEDLKLTPSLIKAYVTKYSHSKNTNGKLWVTLFRNSVIFGSTIEDEVARKQFLADLFKIFQSHTVKKMFNPATLYKIYQVAESFNIDPEAKLSVDIKRYLELYYSKASEPKSSKNEPTIIETFSLISKYEFNLELKHSFISKLFTQVPDDEKRFFIVLLRNIVVNLPYVENIHEFIHRKFKANDPDVYNLFGLEIGNPLSSDPQAKRAKWMRFDIRYFSPLLEVFMSEIITKEKNNSIKTMMIDSLATMNFNENNKDIMKFYELYNKVVYFGGQHLNIKHANIDILVEDLKDTFEDSIHLLQPYLMKPFIYHFMYTNIFAYDLNVIVELLYILTRGNPTLQIFGFWNNIEQSKMESLESQFGLLNYRYTIQQELELMNLFRLIFTAAKYTKDIPINQLAYIINISENLIKSEKISKRNKTEIMNCSFILVGKHSDLLSAFHKKAQQLMPEYKISNSMLTDFIYSTITNNLRETDKVLDYLVSNTNDVQSLNHSCETVIKQLVVEEQNGLAQELYMKYSERKPRFKIPELHDVLSWGKARQPVVTIDSNDGVNMRMDKFKVKLYDYDSLDKEKRG